MYTLFAATAFVGAILTFTIQPMIGKMFLPVMGGTPAVWNTAMVFFQFGLLAGYLYAHLSTQWLGPRRQWILHAALLGVGLLVLPVTIGEPDFTSLMEAQPALWVLLTLLLSAGWPFLLVSSTAPLLQRWLSATRHRFASDPYHLYAASNTGSVIALLSYPFIVEPAWGLSLQSTAWAWGYGVLAAMMITAALFMMKRSGAGIVDHGAVAAKQPPTAMMRLRWLLWAFVPSSLMLSVTTVITTDVAPMPLLWVVPLALYLLTHVHAFARHRLVSTQVLLRLLPVVLMGLMLLLFMEQTEPVWLVALVHLSGLFVIALIFHGLLADHRPEPRHLTSFYLWLALGGALGGSFNALLAPLIFNTLMEYPLILLVAVAALPGAVWSDRWLRHLLLGAMALWAMATLAALLYLQGSDTLQHAWIAVMAIAGVLLLIGVAFWRGTAWTRGAAMACAALVIVDAGMGDPGRIHAARSFYGTHEVIRDGDHHVLVHGNITHGAQNRDERRRDEPLSYYHPSGPLGDVMALLDRRQGRADVAVVGLGSGAIASYRHPSQRILFYEIDPHVQAIATNPELFTYLSDCPVGCMIKLGDGRLTLGREPDGRFELIVLDAYSSAAIPQHLLTAEALQLFRDKLTDDGVIAFHISNNYVDLAPIVSRLAQSLGLAARGKQSGGGDPAHGDHWISASQWMVLAPKEQTLSSLDAQQGWQPVSPDPAPAWTDDHAPVWQAYLTTLRGTGSSHEDASD